MLQGHGDGPGEIYLRARTQAVRAVRGKNRYDKTPAERRDAFHRTAVLAKDHTGDMRAMLISPPCLRCFQTIDQRQLRPGQARVREIYGPIQDGDADFRIASCVLPQLADLLQWIDQA